MKKEKKDGKKESILKYLWSKEQGRAILFFGFYALFFVVVILMLRSAHTPGKRALDKVQTEVTYSYQTEKLEKKNYHYKYLITMGQNVFLYEGDCYDRKELFLENVNTVVTQYFKDGDLFIKNVNGVWAVADNPYIINEFYQLETMKKILENADFISKTQYENGKSELRFTISNKELAKIRNQNEIMGEEENQIMITLDEEKDITKVEYDITNYYRQINETSTQTILELTYSDFGEIKEIEKP